MRRLSLDEQNRRIRRGWPSFKAVLIGNGLGMWVGTVYGLSAPYEVRIIYVTNPYQEGFEWAHSMMPEVRVLSPAIRRRPEAPEDPIPHVYDENRDPNLCLFDPAVCGWTPDMAIADTTIPWIAEWLRFYEAWQATGVWTGGGRVHVPVRRPASSAVAPDRLARRAERLCGCAASRCTLACRIVRPLVPIASWQLIDLVDFALPAIEAVSEPIQSAPIERLAA